MRKFGEKRYPFFKASQQLLRAFIHLFLIAFVCLSCASAALADEINYFYDDAGRLVVVTNPSTNAQFLYQYNAVGNLLGISSGTLNTAPPVLDSISPGVLVKGSKAVVIITGQNLVTTQNLSSDNPDITIYVLSVSDTEIKAAVIIPLSAVTGAVHFTAVTLYGSDSIQASITDSTLHFSPAYLALSSGIRGDITATISPPVDADIPIMLRNSNPATMSAPRFFTIVSSGTSDFSVDPLYAGYSSISSGEAETIVSVSESTTANALPVSIFKEQEQTGTSTVNAFPVSVYKAMQSTITFQALPVSVYREIGYGNPVVVTLPVSTQISVQ
jgi:YD repeat-containing protein